MLGQVMRAVPRLPYENSNFAHVVVSREKPSVETLPMGGWGGGRLLESHNKQTELSSLFHLRGAHNKVVVGAVADGTRCC